MTIRAVWHGTVLAEAETTVRLEGNHYFPPAAVKAEYLVESSSKSLCPWKGIARYYNVVVDGEVSPDAAFVYRRPSFLARKIKNYVAFWQGVRVEGG